MHLRSGPQKETKMEKFLARIEEECRNQIQNFDYFRFNKERLKDKVRFIRYEDLALNQTLYVDSIAKFSETPLSAENLARILKRTNGKKNENENSNKRIKRGDFYTTK